MLKYAGVVVGIVGLMLLAACASGNPDKPMQALRLVGADSGNGIEVQAQTDEDQQTWIPMKEAMEFFGFRHDLNAKTKVMAFGYSDPLFKLYADHPKAWAGQPLGLKNPPLRIEGQEAWVTVNTLAEVLDASVHWHNNGSEVRLLLPRDEQASPFYRMAQTDGSVRVNGSGSLRTAPSVQSTVIRFLKMGELVEIISKTNPYWFQIRDQHGTIGYLSSRYLTSGNEPAPAAERSQSQVQTPTANAKERVIEIAETLLGVKYKFGSRAYSETGTFDCSSFVQHVFNQVQIELPRSSRSQANKGIAVARSNLRQGDLVFFSTPGRFSNNRIVGHVAIYKGDGKIIHTYGKPGVVVSDLDSKSWSGRYLFSKRVLP